MAIKKKKVNFIRKYKHDYRRGEKEVTFNFSVASKALFNLSGDALKLYLLLILNGKRAEPSVKRFAKMMNKSERTISRIYNELKEKDFLKITPIGINRYKYDFDPFGKVSIPKKPKGYKAEKEIVQEPQEIIKDVVASTKPKTKINLEKAKTIKEYEDFAILENFYWTLPKEEQKEILEVLKERIKIETDSKDPIQWFLDKTEMR